MILLLKNQWDIKKTKQEDRKLIDEILESRNVIKETEKDIFLNPPCKIYHDPFLFKDMECACKLITSTIDSNGKILIYGDYDVDGITSVASLYLYLKSLDANLEYIIPDRISEGYGLGQAGLEKILSKEISLLITVDCGVSSIDEIKILKENNINVIITDHHECKPELPIADAIINPKRDGDNYPFQGLAGAGVTLKLIQALCTYEDSKSAEREWEKYLDFVCLGTIGDIVPLIDENRMIVSYGLSLLNQYKRLGIKLLLEKLEMTGKDITELTVSYTLVPHINASGRMGDGSRALNLLTETNPDICSDTAQELILENIRRRETETEIFEKAKADLLETYDPLSYGVLVAFDKNWHQGVLGIVASRLCEYFRRSVIVFGWDGQHYKGSARSSGQDSVLDAIEHAKDYTVAYGGHKKAAGLSVDEERLEEFIAKVKEYSKVKDVSELYENSIPIDFRIRFSDLTSENANDLEKLSPFGEANKNPLFVCEGLYVCQIRDLSGGKHLKLVLSEDDLSLLDFRQLSAYNTVEGIAFGISGKDYNICPGDLIDVVFHMQINEWQGRKGLQIVIKDLRKTPTSIDAKMCELEDLYVKDPKKAFDFMNNNIHIKDFAIPKSKDFNFVYRFLKSNYWGETVVCDIDVLSFLMTDEKNKKISLFKLSRIFDIFEETKLIKIRNISNTRKIFELLDTTTKVNLSESETYKKFM